MLEDSFNFYFDLITEAKSGTPIIKKNCLLQILLKSKKVLIYVILRKL